MHEYYTILEKLLMFLSQGANIGVIPFCLIPFCLTKSAHVPFRLNFNFLFVSENTESELVDV